MPEWFVYSNAQYYPSAAIVDAATAEDALAEMNWARPEDGVVVFPMEALALTQSPEDWPVLKDLRDDADPLP